MASTVLYPVNTNIPRSSVQYEHWTEVLLTFVLTLCSTVNIDFLYAYTVLMLLSSNTRYKYLLLTIECFFTAHTIVLLFNISVLHNL
jgi:hypothetical protein